MKETFLLAVKTLLFTENILLLLNYFIKKLSVFINKPLRYESLQSYIQNFSLQVISFILNITRGMKRDESVNGQPQGQSFLFQDHVLEF
jgi:cytochrome c biogenesis protein ResB